MLKDKTGTRLLASRVVTRCPRPGPPTVPHWARKLTPHRLEVSRWLVPVEPGTRWRAYLCSQYHAISLATARATLASLARSSKYLDSMFQAVTVGSRLGDGGRPWARRAR